MTISKTASLKKATSATFFVCNEHSTVCCLHLVLANNLYCVGNAQDSRRVFALPHSPPSLCANDHPRQQWNGGSLPKSTQLVIPQDLCFIRCELSTKCAFIECAVQSRMWCVFQDTLKGMTMSTLLAMCWGHSR